jgi:hypothetical protein
LRRWHALLQRRLAEGIVVVDGRQTNAKDGTWERRNRYNVDQVPMNFNCQSKMTFERKGAKRVWIAGAKGCDEKRMATLQLCVVNRNAVMVHGKPQHQQMKQTVVFKGTGKRISKAEYAAYDKRVIVRFHKKAYYDGPTCIEWCLTDYYEQLSAADLHVPKVMFCDNFKPQTTPEFINALATSNTALHLLPAGTVCYPMRNSYTETKRPPSHFPRCYRCDGRDTAGRPGHRPHVEVRHRPPARQVASSTGQPGEMDPYLDGVGAPHPHHPVGGRGVRGGVQRVRHHHIPTLARSAPNDAHTHGFLTSCAGWTS